LEPIAQWGKTTKPPKYNYSPNPEDLHKKYPISLSHKTHRRLALWIKDHVIKRNVTYQKHQELRKEKKDYPETSLIQRLDKSLVDIWDDYNLNQGYIETGNPMIDIPRKNNREEYLNRTILIHAMGIEQKLKGLIEFDDHHEEDFIYKDLSYDEYLIKIEDAKGVERLKSMHSLLMIASSLVRAKREYVKALIRKPIISNSQDITTDFKKPNADTSTDYE